jgi:hypothetical protein
MEQQINVNEIKSHYNLLKVIEFKEQIMYTCKQNNQIRGKILVTVGQIMSSKGTSLSGNKIVASMERSTTTCATRIWTKLKEIVEHMK